jgi:hypothetical protein
MEYRARANDWLSNKVTQHERGGYYMNGKPSSVVLHEVKLMLIGDKIQNRKDFELYHKGKHERSAELDLYFKEWLKFLDVTEERYQEVIEMLQKDS